MTRTLEATPQDATHWNTRSMARECGLSQSAISRIWRAFALQPQQRKTLERWGRAGTTPQRMVLRSQICLLGADGRSNNAIAKELGTSRPTVLLWRERFQKQGLLGLSVHNFYATVGCRKVSWLTSFSRPCSPGERS